jgi:hypothetical protein
MLRPNAWSLHNLFELAFGLDQAASERMVAAYETQTAQQTMPSESPVDPETVAPYLGVYEHGAALEMRGDDLWLIGAFVQTQLYAANEADVYMGSGVYSALSIRFTEANGHFTLEILYPDNPPLALGKVE